jgi:hypothetical protein
MMKKIVKDLQILLLSELVSAKYLRQAMRTVIGTSLYNVVLGTKQ